MIYMLGALVSLLMLGRLPDRLGFRVMLMVSIVLTIFGTVLSMFATGAGVLLVGRFIVGLAASIATPAGSAALRLVLPAHLRPRMSLIYSLVMALGFGLGPFTGGVLGQVAAEPLVTSYWPTVLCGILALVGLVLFVRDDRRGRARVAIGDILPKMTMPPVGTRMVFAVGCAGGFLGFSVFGLFATMVPLFVEQMMHLKGPMVSGVSIAAIFVFSALTQLSMQKAEAERTLRLGLAAFALCCLCLAVNLSLNMPVLFVLAVLGASVGHGMTLLGSMSLCNRIATVDNQAGLTATYMVVGYAGGVLSALGLGWGADRFGMQASVAGFCSIMIVSSVAVIVTSLVTSKR